MNSRVIVLFQWNELTPEHYQKVIETVEKNDVPKDRILHCAGFHNNGLRVTDVWESAQAFDTFVKNSLMPIIGELGIKGQPAIEVFPLANLTYE